MVNLANVANLLTSPATSRSMQMTIQMKKHSNCEFQQQKLILFVLLILISNVFEIVHLHELIEIK